MTRWLMVGGLCLAMGCNGDGGGFLGDLGGGDGGDGSIGRDDIPSTATLEQSMTGNLSDGAPEADLGFLESNTCVPATQTDKFNGHWVWYTYQQPAGVQVYVQADPANGVDVSLIVSQDEAGSSATGSSGVTGLCEEGLDYGDSGNPGSAESVKVTSVDQAYHLVIGVAGAFGEDDGEFELEIYEE